MSEDDKDQLMIDIVKENFTDEELVVFALLQLGMIAAMGSGKGKKDANLRLGKIERELKEQGINISDVVK